MTERVTTERSNYPSLYPRLSETEIEEQPSSFNPDPFPTRISWPNELPTPACWKNSYLMRPAGTTPLATGIATGIATGALTFYLYHYMVGTPATVVRTVRMASLTALALTALGIWIRCKPYLEDERPWSKKGQAAEQRFHAKETSFPAFRNRYQQLY